MFPPFRRLCNVGVAPVEASRVPVLIDPAEMIGSSVIPWLTFALNVPLLVRLMFPSGKLPWIVWVAPIVSRSVPVYPRRLLPITFDPETVPDPLTSTSPVMLQFVVAPAYDRC